MKNEPSGRIIGYARVSSKDQNINRQIDALNAEGIPTEDIYTDKSTGASFNRPGYIAMVESLSPGDTIVITSLDRLGRNYEEILEQWRHVTKTLGANFRVLDMPLLGADLGNDVMNEFFSDLVLQVLSFQSETERMNIKQRQAEGIAAAKARGQKFGRPRKPLPDNFDEIYKKFTEGQSINSLAKECNLSMSTLRLRLYERFEEEQKKN